MDEGQRKQSPIFSKTYDFTLWLMQHTERFPKHERFRLAKRLDDTALDFYHLLIQAARNSGQRKALLAQADLRLDMLRLYFRLAVGRKLTSPQQYHFAAGQLTEIGKLLGGWLKTLA
jgi:hypothetical protein